MANKTKGSKALTNSINIKLSDDDIASLSILAGEFGMNKTEYIRAAVKEKNERVKVADDLFDVITAGMSRVEEVVRKQQVIHDIISRLETLEKKVVTKTDFDELDTKVSSIKSSFNLGFKALSVSYEQLNVNIKTNLEKQKAATTEQISAGHKSLVHLIISALNNPQYRPKTNFLPDAT